MSPVPVVVDQATQIHKHRHIPHQKIRAPAQSSWERNVVVASMGGSVDNVNSILHFGALGHQIQKQTKAHSTPEDSSTGEGGPV